MYIIKRIGLNINQNYLLEAESQMNIFLFLNETHCQCQISLCIMRKYYKILTFKTVFFILTGNKKKRN